MDVSIIMINYNTCQLTLNAIHSIKKETEGIEYELFLIDNNSSDSSKEEFIKKYQDEKWIHLLFNEENLGTSKAFNKAAKMAVGKYVLWINSDILLEENFIKKLFDFMEENPNCGVCGGNLVDFNHNPTDSCYFEEMNLKSIKREFSILHLLYLKTLGRKKEISTYNFSKKNLPVNRVIGADMFTRRDVLEEVGYLDEDIFMYGEETLFEWKVKKAGYEIYSVYDAKMCHLEGASSKGSKKNSEFKDKNSLYGHGIYFLKAFSKEEQIKYYKLKLKQYRERRILLFFSKEQREKYTRKIQYAKQFLEETQRC